MKKPTLEDLAELCARSAELVGEMVTENAALRERVRVLEEKVARLENRTSAEQAMGVFGGLLDE